VQDVTIDLDNGKVGFELADTEQIEQVKANIKDAGYVV